MRYFLLLNLLIYSSAILAQDEKQVLVFHHSGHVDLFFADELDSISCSRLDTNRIEHDSIISQIFYTKDSLFIFPINDIDSVVFGNRNEIEYQAEVIVLTSKDLEWIIKFEENIIYFKPNTPDTILPIIGNKLFYPEMTELFPYGLTAIVRTVSREKEYIMVTLETIELAEIYERFFYAGAIEVLSSSSTKRKTPGFETNLDVGTTIELGSHQGMSGDISIKGGVDIIGRCVIQPLKNYYYVDMELRPSYDFNIKIVGKEAKSSLEKELWHRSLPPVGIVLVPSIDATAFLEANASLQFNYEMSRSFHQQIIWKRVNGINKIIYSNPNNLEPIDHAKIDVLLDGNLYLGLGLNLNFALIGESIGTRAMTKIGPEISGKISLDIVRDLSKSNYDATTYNSAGQLSFAMRADLEGYVIGREHGLWGDVENKMQLIGITTRFSKYTIDLFPKFQDQKAVKNITNNTSSNISLVTKTTTELAHPLQTGFQILHKNYEVLHTEYIDTLQKETNEVQKVFGIIELNNIDDKNLLFISRPIFRYQGYTIPYAAINVAQDPAILPITTYMSNGKYSIISGSPIVGLRQADSTSLHIGNYLPIPYFDADFVAINPFAEYTYISDAQKQFLYGTWEGTIDNMQIAITLNENEIGSLQMDSIEQMLTYTLNFPNDGNITLNIEDQTKRLFSIKSLSSLYLVLQDIENNAIIKLTKKN